MRNLDWSDILSTLENFATSVQAKEILRATSPLTSVAAAEKQFADTASAIEVLNHGTRPHMESLDVFPMWWERIRKNAVLKTLELRDVRKFCHEVLALGSALEPLESAWATGILASLMDAEKPLSAIDQLMSPQGEIRIDASEKLHSLYLEKGNLARQIQNQLDKLVKSFDLEPVLQDKYVTNREGRWVLPIRSGAQHQFQGIIHASSHTKQTVFMEPEQIVPLNNRLTQVENEIEQEIERLLIQISNYLSSLVSEFAATKEILTQVDVRLAQAQLAVALSANPCEFTDSELHLIELKHPALVLRQAGQVVANTVKLDQRERVLLLSGPNAGGKTVLLKAVGLAAQMARCGLFICADSGSRMPFFAEITTAVGDAQSVDAKLSTFAAHVSILNQGLKLKGLDRLLLVDEICGSTDPEEGCALARSFIESYIKNSVFGVITSHLGPLKLGWAEGSGVVNGSMEYDSMHDKPSYRFLKGVPGDSLALQTAQRVGVNTDVLDRAYNLLAPETRRLHDHMKEMEQLKGQVSDLQKELQRQLRQTEHRRHEYQKKLDQFEIEKEKWLREYIDTTEKKINEMVEQAKVQQIFKKFEVMNQIKSSFPEMVKPTKFNGQWQRATVTSADDFTKAFPPGSTVFVPSLGQDGVVQGTPNAKGEVPVLSQSLRLVVPWADLQPPRRQANPTAQLLRKSSLSVAVTQDFESQIDLRGLRVDEAVSKLETALDQAALRGQDRVKIVHGHGTEALKKSVRAHLSRSPYVRTWQAGQDDGVTWAELND
jgi:DNA mismatch repair protein MutS2